MPTRKRVKIRAYTSSVPVSNTVNQLTDLLVEVGATRIAQAYNADREIEGITFGLVVDGQPMAFHIRSQAQAIEEAMRAAVKRPRRDTYAKIKDQAARTAWRILYDGLDIQVTNILIAKKDPLEVFLPYLYDANHDRTLYEHVKQNGIGNLMISQTKGARD